MAGPLAVYGMYLLGLWPVIWLYIACICCAVACRWAVLHACLGVCGLWSVHILNTFLSAMLPMLKQYTVPLVRLCSQCVAA